MSPHVPACKEAPRVTPRTSSKEARVPSTYLHAIHHFCLQDGMVPGKLSAIAELLSELQHLGRPVAIGRGQVQCDVGVEFHGCSFAWRFAAAIHQGLAHLRHLRSGRAAREGVERRGQKHGPIGSQQRHMGKQKVLLYRGSDTEHTSAGVVGL